VELLHLGEGRGVSQGPAALLQGRKQRGGSAACSGASQIRSQGRERGRPRGSRGGRGECSSREGRAAALQQEERGGGAGVGELLRPLAASARGWRGSRGGRRRGRDEGQQRKKRIAYQRSELGDALVGIVIHVVSIISTEAAFPTIGF